MVPTLEAGLQEGAGQPGAQELAWVTSDISWKHLDNRAYEL